MHIHTLNHLHRQYFFYFFFGLSLCSHSSLSTHSSMMFSFNCRFHLPYVMWMCGFFLSFVVFVQITQRFLCTSAVRNLKNNHVFISTLNEHWTDIQQKSDKSFLHFFSLAHVHKFTFCIKTNRFTRTEETRMRFRFFSHWYEQLTRFRFFFLQILLFLFHLCWCVDHLSRHFSRYNTNWCVCRKPIN